MFFRIGRSVTHCLLGSVMVLASSQPAPAGEADVTDVKATRTGQNVYRFDVTVRHADTGWDHYADRWDVLTPDGDLLGQRTLHHPHVNEQPFTRSLTGVKIPKGTTTVTIRAHDSVHGLGGAAFVVDLSE